MECTLTGCKKKKGSLFLTKINEWNSVQSQSNLNFQKGWNGIRKKYLFCKNDRRKR